MYISKTLLKLMKPIGIAYLLWQYKLSFVTKIKEVVGLVQGVVFKRNNILISYSKNHPIWSTLARNPPSGVRFIQLTSQFKGNALLNFLASKIDISYEDAPTPCQLITTQPIVKESEHPYFDKELLTNQQVKKILLYSNWAKPEVADPENKMEVLPPVPPLKKQRVKEEKDQIVILMSGAAAARKGADILYQAFENVEQQLGAQYNLFLLMASNYNRQDPWYLVNHDCFERVKRFHAKCKSKKNVYFSGLYPPSLVDYIYDYADIYVLPARFDTCPFSVLEAMNSGLPIITTHIQSFPEMVQHEHNGFLIDVKDFDLQSQAFFEYAVAELEKYLLRLIKDKSLRIQMGEKSKQKIAKNFNIEYKRQRLKTIFTEIMQEQKK